MTFIDLSHDIHHGMVTEPGLPAPVVAEHLSRDAAEQLYGPGVTFQIGLLTMCTDTGTYIDVPFHRDHSQHFGTDRYLVDHPFLLCATADALVNADVACVGIDSLNIDSTADMQRPVHSMLLGAGIPIVEHLTNLADYPATGSGSPQYRRRSSAPERSPCVPTRLS